MISQLFPFKITAFFFLLFNQTFSQSFNCEKASTPIEKAICSDEILGNLDEKLSEEYKFGKKVFGKKYASDLINSQKKWILERNKRFPNGNIDSLKSFYRDRIKTIKQSVIDDLEWYSGKYKIEKEIGMFDPSSQEYISEDAYDEFNFKWINTEEISFSIGTVSSNANLCDLNGTAVRNKKGKYVWKREDNQTYGVEIYLDSNGWWYFKLLPGSDPSDGCGLNAFIYDIRFKRTEHNYLAESLE